MILAETIEDVAKSENMFEVKKRYEIQLEQLNSRIEEIARTGIKSESDYMYTSSSKLLAMMIDCEQYDINIDPDGEAILVDRVIKVNRYIKSFYLDMHGIDHTVLGGLFLVAPIYLLPGNKVKKASKNRWHSIFNPEEYGLPSSEACDYATIKPLDHNSYIALAKFENNYINELVKFASKYDYVFPG